MLLPSLTARGGDTPLLPKKEKERKKENEEGRGKASKEQPKQGRSNLSRGAT